MNISQKQDESGPAQVSPAPPAGKPHGALGLPSGSIRAVLTLMTVGFITIQTGRGIHVGLLWFESLMIVLAHYFAYRRLVQLTPELRAQLIADGVLEAEPNPLYLPGHAVRILIILAFAALAGYLARHDRLLDPVALPIFIALGSYFLGIGVGAVTRWWTKGKRSSGSSRFDDIKAIATLAAMSLTIVVQLMGWQDLVPYGQKLEALPLALMLFYFGSR